jgi:hypothetical protein
MPRQIVTQQPLGALSLLPAVQAAREVAGAQWSAYWGKTLTFTLSTTQPGRPQDTTVCTGGTADACRPR